MCILADSQPTATGEPTLDVGELEEEFHSLTLLLTLISAMNNEFNHPTLTQTSLNGAQVIQVSQPTTHSLALNAIATVIVRDNETIAVSGSLSPSADAPNQYDAHVLVVLQDQPQTKLVPTGLSHWSSVLKDHWHGLNIRYIFYPRPWATIHSQQLLQHRRPFGKPYRYYCRFY
jgi:hypothetical protein